MRESRAAKIDLIFPDFHGTAIKEREREAGASCVYLGELACLHVNVHARDRVFASLGGHECVLCRINNLDGSAAGEDTVQTWLKNIGGSSREGSKHEEMSVRTHRRERSCCFFFVLHFFFNINPVTRCCHMRVVKAAGSYPRLSSLKWLHKPQTAHSTRIHTGDWHWRAHMHEARGLKWNDSTSRPVHVSCLVCWVCQGQRTSNTI